MSGGDNWGKCFRNYYKGHRDKTTAGMEIRDGGGFGWGGGDVVVGKCRQL